MPRYRIALSFERVRCERCGIERIRGVPCADCGCHPADWEVDPRAERRRRVGQELSGLLTSARLEGGDGTVWSDWNPLAASQQLRGWMDRFWTAVTECSGADFRDVGALQASIEELLALESAIVSSKPPKPLTRAADLAVPLAESLRSMLSCYLRALSAMTPIEAQRLGAEAQRWLDQASVLDGELDAWLATQTALEEADSSDALRTLMDFAEASTGAQGLLELASAFQSRLEELLGVDAGPECAILYALRTTFAEVFLDPRELDRKLIAAVEQLDAGGPRLEALLSSRAFGQDLAALELELFDSGVACQNVVAKATHIRQAARAVVDLQAGLVETAGRIFAGPLLVATGQKVAPYESLREGNATTLLTKAQEHCETAALLEGLDAHLRTAQAHRAVTYEELGLRTDLRSGARLYSYDDLVDLTFRAIESVLAGTLALRIVAAKRGVELAGDSSLAALGLSPEQIADFVLGCLGRADVGVDLADGILRLNLPNSEVEGSTPAIGAVLAALAGEHVRLIVLHPSSNNELHCDPSVYEHFRATSSPFGKQLALMRIQAAWRDSDGDSHLQRPALRKWCATQVTETLDMGPRDQLTALRSLRDLAAELQDASLESTLSDVIRWARLSLTGNAGEESGVALASVLEWAQLEVDFDLI